MRRMAHLGRRRAAALAMGLTLVAGIVGVPSSAQAADLTQFQSGMIIADEVFYSPGAMSASEVATFLADKGRNCVPSSTGVPCLKDFRQTTHDRAASARCAAYAGADSERASEIIAKVALACGINPQVLLVILQKEQGLVTASGATLTTRRYQAAMGYRCPDSGGCDPAYAGFFNQVYSASAQFQAYAADPGKYNHIAGRVNTVLYHPNTACGGSSIFIRNQATAGLYNYTPYQPNAASLAAGYGTGDACSSYGNRNFWNYFRDWFGPTEGEAYNPFGRFDSLAGRPGGLHVEGWAVDPDTAGPIYVLATVDGVGHYLLANTDRPDVGQAFPASGGAHGFSALIPAAAGSHEVCLTASNVQIGRHTSLGCRVGTVPGGSPTGNFEGAEGVPGGVDVRGWALDPDAVAPVYLWVTLDGVGRYVYANVERADVGAVFPGYGSAHGFAATLPASVGVHTVCITVANLGVGSNTALGCRAASAL